MEVTGFVIALVGLLILISIVSTSVSPRVGIPVLLLYLLVGMLAGEDGVLGIQFADAQTAQLIGSAALAVILFDGGLRTELRTFRVGLRPALGLATVGVLVTAAVTAAAIVWIFGLGWMEALLMGAIVGSTDAAAVFALLHGRGMVLKDRVAATLEIESGANDPMAVFLTVVLVEAVATGVEPGWQTGAYFFWQMGVGALVGLACGRALAWGVTQLTLNAGLYPLLVLFGGLFTFGVALVVDSSGFLAVYLAGLVLSSRVSRGLFNIQRFIDGAAWLSQIAMFLMLGLLVTPRELLPYAGDAAVIALVLIFVARPVAVYLCLLPFRFSWRERAFIAWVGLRGAVPIILALFPWLAGMEQWHTYFNLAFFVVLFSLLLQGWTVAPLARWLKLEIPSRTGRVQRLEIGIPGQEEHELVGYDIDADSPMAGMPLAHAAWPEHVQALVVLRKRTVVKADDVPTLASGDQLYLLARPEALASLDRMMLGERDPERLGEREFFGEFVIRPDAPLGALAAIYGFDLDHPHAGRSIGDHLRRTFPRPVVGDRLRLGQVEFVVREVERDDIVKLGLKLNRV